MSTALVDTFEQARQQLHVAQERLRLDRRQLADYQRQAQGAGLRAEAQQAFCAEARARVQTSVEHVTQARSRAEAAYQRIPLPQRPAVDYI